MIWRRRGVGGTKPATKQRDVCSEGYPDIWQLWGVVILGEMLCVEQAKGHR
jgi:hypothetical protein